MVIMFLIFFFFDNLVANILLVPNVSNIRLTNGKKIENGFLHTT